MQGQGLLRQGALEHGQLRRRVAGQGPSLAQRTGKTVGQMFKMMFTGWHEH